MLKSSPTIQQNEGGNGRVPHRSPRQGESDESENADEAKDSGDHQAAGTPDHEPEQTAQDLAAVERINWQNVVGEQEEVDIENRLQ